MVTKTAEKIKAKNGRMDRLQEKLANDMGIRLAI